VEQRRGRGQKGGMVVLAERRETKPRGGYVALGLFRALERSGAMRALSKVHYIVIKINRAANT
jgi:hypothetical protein